MPLLNYSGSLVGGQPEDINEVISRFNQVRAVINALDDDNFDVAGTPLDYTKLNLANKIRNVDVKSDAAIHHSKLDLLGAVGAAEMFSDASEESTSSLAFVDLGDVVTGIELEAPGLLFVVYRALWKQVGATDASGAIWAALHVDGVPVDQVVGDAGVAAAPGVLLGGDVASPNWNPLFSSAVSDGLNVGAGGLATAGQTVADSTVGTDPQMFGMVRSTVVARVNYWQPAVIEVPAGTYDVGVRFRKDSDPDSGDCHVKDRRLYVWSRSFA